MSTRENICLIARAPFGHRQSEPTLIFLVVEKRKIYIFNIYTI